jgi:hypothetical protein
MNLETQLTSCELKICHFAYRKGISLILILRIKLRIKNGLEIIIPIVN